MSLEKFLEEFDEAAVEAEYPNARRILTGGLFISHAGADFERIQDLIAFPVLLDRFGDGFFLHSRKSGGSKSYKLLVRAALHWCNKFVLVASRNIEGHEWVQAEVRWLFRAGKSLIVCQLDDVNVEGLHPEIACLLSTATVQGPHRLLDFRGPNFSHAQAELATAIDDMLATNPYPRFPKGPPGRQSR